MIKATILMRLMFDAIIADKMHKKITNRALLVLVLLGLIAPQFFPSAASAASSTQEYYCDSDNTYGGNYARLTGTNDSGFGCNDSVAIINGTSDTLPTNFSITSTCPGNQTPVLAENMHNSDGAVTDYTVTCSGGGTPSLTIDRSSTAGSGDKRTIDNDCDPESPDEQLNQENCGIIKYIVLFINVLSGIAGIVIVASIIIGGIQYSAAGPDPQKVSAAKARIRNAIIALVFFLFGVAILNFLVPGGIL